MPQTSERPRADLLDGRGEPPCAIERVLMSATMSVKREGSPPFLTVGVRAWQDPCGEERTPGRRPPAA